MFQEFLAYCKENALFDKNKDKILLAVSGGIDSMVMTHLFLRTGCNFAIAHCNFHLRGEESDRDERFVSDFAERNNLTLYKQEFDTYTYMANEKKSLEMSARDLRYDWFNKIMKENDYNLLATAHHSDDSAETFLINLLRGTGIAGLHGILPKSGNIIRPLLFTSRRKIQEYATKHGIAHIEDSTNKDNKFTRNKIRNEIIPVLREISPNFDTIIRKDIERLRETEKVFRKVVEDVKKDILIKRNDRIEIEIEKLKSLQPLHIYIYEILSEYGFNDSNINDICSLLNTQNNSGKQFFSEDYRIIFDRNHLFITKKDTANTLEENYSLYDYQTNISTPVRLHTEILRDLKFIKIPKVKSVAMFDYDKLKFPLVLRHWHEGDLFHPFGMRGKQKLSDFFTHNKYSILDKEKQWLLCSGDEIIWVMGVRIDDRVRITQKTQTIYKVEIDD